MNNDDNSTVTGTFNDIIDGIGKVKPKVKFKRNRILKPTDKVDHSKFPRPPRPKRKNRIKKKRPHKKRKVSRVKRYRQGSTLNVPFRYDSKRLYSFVDIEYFKSKMIEWEIYSEREYLQLIRYVSPRGFPVNPVTIYGVTLAELLPNVKPPNHLLPYTYHIKDKIDLWELAAIVSKYRINGIKEYIKKVRNGELEYGKFPVSPYVAYGETFKKMTWNVYLGRTAKDLLTIKKHLDRILVVYRPDPFNPKTVRLHRHHDSQTSLLEGLQKKKIEPLRMYVLDYDMDKKVKELIASNNGVAKGDKKRVVYSFEDLNSFLFDLDVVLKKFKFNKKIVKRFEKGEPTHHLKYVKTGRYVTTDDIYKLRKARDERTKEKLRLRELEGKRVDKRI